MYFLAGAKVSVETWKNTKDFIRNALTTYSNQRELEGIEKVEKGVPDFQDPDLANNNHNQVYRVGHSDCRQATLDHIERVKKELT
jgi:hypothetical protein